MTHNLCRNSDANQNDNNRVMRAEIKTAYIYSKKLKKYENEEKRSHKKELLLCNKAVKATLLGSTKKALKLQLKANDKHALSHRLEGDQLSILRNMLRSPASSVRLLAEQFVTAKTGYNVEIYQQCLRDSNSITQTTDDDSPKDNSTSMTHQHDSSLQPQYPQEDMTGLPMYSPTAPPEVTSQYFTMSTLDLSYRSQRCGQYVPYANIDNV